MPLFESSQILIVLLVLCLPLLVHPVEKNLEVFLFIMGILAATVSHFFGPGPVFSFALWKEALVEPVKITAAVLLAGLVFHYCRGAITRQIIHWERRIGPHVFAFLLVVLLGFLSSVITAIIAAILLVEIIYALALDKGFETRLVIVACFSIGLGAALTPVGEPLSTIVIAKLRPEPYHADFFFLLRNLGKYIIPGVIALGILAAFLRTIAGKGIKRSSHEKAERLSHVFVRTGKVYLFVMALILLGAGFKPIIDLYLLRVPDEGLYFINIISAILDNATLAAAEISPAMSLAQINGAIMGLLIAGGMLIPGNIPNIISAGKLRIRSRDWARFGVPLGAVLMALYFVIIFLL